MYHLNHMGTCMNYRREIHGSISTIDNIKYQSKKVPHINFNHECYEINGMSEYHP